MSYPSTDCGYLVFILISMAATARETGFSAQAVIVPVYRLRSLALPPDLTGRLRPEALLRNVRP